MRQIFGILFIITTLAITATAQSESELKKYFEGKLVVFRIDMPASEAVNVYPERSQPLNYSEYSTRLKNSGVSIKRASNAKLTNIRVKDSRIEVQFAAANLGSSRFNIYFERIESWMLTPATVIEALNRFVEFTDAEKYFAQLQQSSKQAAGFVRNRVVHLGPRTTYLKQGLSTEQVRKLLGEPSSVVERSEGGKLVSTYEFPRGDGRVLITEFAGDALVESRTETRSAAALASLNPSARAEQR